MTQILDWDIRMAKHGIGPVQFGSSATGQIISLKEFPNLKGVYLAVRTSTEQSPMSFHVSVEFGEGNESVEFKYSRTSHEALGAQTFGDWTLIPLENLAIKTPNDVRVWLKHSIRVKSFRAVS